MSAIFDHIAARCSAASSGETSGCVLKSSSHYLTPAAAVPRPWPAFGNGFGKNTKIKTHIPFRFKVVCKPDSANSSGPNQLQHVTKENPCMNLFSLFKEQHGESSYNLPKLPRRAPIKPTKAYKISSSPVLANKPEWWWRTLACVPYLIALQISAAGHFVQPLLEHYGCFENLTCFVPGTIARLPIWFTWLYCRFAYGGIVKNRGWPQFFRVHLMMGLLLKTSWQIVWLISNFFPLIHHGGRLGMYYWAGVGMAYILVLLQCVLCALAGGYAHLPFISETAYDHAQLNTGGSERP